MRIPHVVGRLKQRENVAGIGKRCMYMLDEQFLLACVHPVIDALSARVRTRTGFRVLIYPVVSTDAEGGAIGDPPVM